MSTSDAAVNPFHELYVTETIKPDNFVTAFSPLLISDTLALFQPGNVILKGVQGCGKSMLLSLLKPEVQAAYAAQAVQFPVPTKLSRFIGAGINLIRSDAIAFGQRSIESKTESDLERHPAYFADFVNYMIVRDILDSLEKLSSSREGNIGNQLGLNFSDAAKKKLIGRLCRDPCWFGYLEKIETYAQLRKKLTERISSYRRFLNFSLERIPRAIRSSKTSPGEPVSVAAQSLWDSAIVPEDVQFYIRIDQYEELSRLEAWSEEKDLYHDYQAVIHKMLGTRDPRVSYRIGTRRHGWRTTPRMFGTTTAIEELRNYKTVDLDWILREKENIPSVFRRFAEDVFRRRLKVAGFGPLNDRTKYIRKVFGPKISPDKKARLYTKNPKNAVNTEKEWPKRINKLLSDLAQEDPLSAKLGEAWVRQQMAKERPDLPKRNELPWEQPRKKWWKKERVAQALLQIAASQRQKMLWAGTDDILGLSGGNVLVFLSICQYVWAAWQRSLPSPQDTQKDRQIPSIENIYIQDEGVQTASQYWYRKIRTDPGGDTRQRLITVIANTFRERLSDKRMSYPGENGFSVSAEDLNRDPNVKHYVEEAAAFGVLFDRHHTPKSRSMRSRIKWYLNPILCPYFQIPAAHTKEPYYVDIETLRDWLKEAGATDLFLASGVDR